MGFGETSSATGFDYYGYNAYGVSVGVVSVIFGTLAIFLVMQSAQNPSFAKFFSWISYFLCVLPTHRPRAFCRMHWHRH